MKLLRLAVEYRRWDLAAHTIVLATVRVLKGGTEAYAGKGKQKRKQDKDRAAEKRC